ncbi:MAG: ArsR/SmtB family transcription factor [Longimicrobiales bacterium]
MKTQRRQDQFSTLDRDTARWAKALGHPARVAILQILARRKTCVCGEIVEDLPLAQSTVSQHLRVLREAGLITGEVEGPRSCYCIDADRIRQVRQDLDQLLQCLEGASGCGC